MAGSGRNWLCFVGHFGISSCISKFPSVPQLKLELDVGARKGSLHALPHPAVLECERRVQPRVLPLVVLVEVQAEAEELQRLVAALRQLEQEGPDHVLVALAHYLQLRLDGRQRGPREGPLPPLHGLLLLRRDPVVAGPAPPPEGLRLLHARLGLRGRRRVQPVKDMRPVVIWK